VHQLNSGREAKEYLIERIVLEADREGVPLSETERKMMCFTETAWTLPDIWEVNESFERDYDDSVYEAKIGELAHKARACAAAAGELETWNGAVQVLKREDHYLLVLLTASAKPSESHLADRLKLVGTALIVCLLLLAGAFFFSTRK
jgi:hypothetical protein